jgi:hypothetical protein
MVPKRRPASRTIGDVVTIDIGDRDFSMHEKGRRSGSTSRREKPTAVQDERIQNEVEERRKAREEELQKSGKAAARKRKKKVVAPAPVAAGAKRHKTTGELLASGKTKQAQRRLARLSTKTVEVAQSDDFPAVEFLSRPVSEFTSEHEFLQEYEHIYGTQSTIIRRLEARLTDEDSNISSKDIYALSTMYSQMRETIADMRSIKDMNTQAEALAMNVFDPAMKAAGESLVNVYFKLNTLLRQHVKDATLIEVLLDKLKQDIAIEGGSLQNQLTISRGKILEVLAGG